MRPSGEEKNKKVETDELFQKGNRLLRQGRLDESEECFAKILAHNPKHLNALNKMGVVCATRRNFPKAEEYFQKILAIEPSHVPALTNLGSIFLEYGNIKKAEEYYREALSHDPDYGPAHNNMGSIYKKRGDFAKMVQSLKKARRAGYLTLGGPGKALSFFLNPGCLALLVLVLLILLLHFVLGGR